MKNQTKLAPYSPRSQRKAKAARSRRLNTWMPRLEEAMFRRHRLGSLFQ